MGYCIEKIFDFSPVFPPTHNKSISGGKVSLMVLKSVYYFLADSSGNIIGNFCSKFQLIFAKESLRK
jgi:hypothetical protein